MHSNHLYVNLPTRPLSYPAPKTSLNATFSPIQPPPYCEAIRLPKVTCKSVAAPSPNTSSEVNKRTSRWRSNSIGYRLRKWLSSPKVCRITKWMVLVLTVIQLIVFLLCLLRFARNEHFRLYSKHGPMFTIGVHLCLINAILTGAFQLYAISTQLFPLLCVLASLQLAYLSLQLCSLLFEHFLVENVYFVFTLLTLLQSMLLSAFLLTLRLRKRAEQSESHDLPPTIGLPFRCIATGPRQSSDYLFQQYLNYLKIVQLDLPVPRSNRLIPTANTASYIDVDHDMNNNPTDRRISMPRISTAVEC